jgi:glutamate carboxypeptidase
MTGDMDASALPFDADEMLAGLRPWVECESPTYDASAVDRMADIAARDLAVSGATVERIPGRMGFGGCVRARFETGSREPGILISGHLDTVHPVGTLAALPFRRDGERCYGPGILDMKAGDYIALEAMRQLTRAGVTPALPVTILFTSDEEVGTPSTRDLIEMEAARSRYVLVPEPALPGNGVVTGRYAIARFALATIGRPSHAGVAPAAGRSAIREMARRILAIEAMSAASCTFSVGVVRAGPWVNCVASRCDAEALSMAKEQADLDAGVARMVALAGTENDVKFVVERGVTRPVWAPAQPGTMQLYEIAKDIARSLGSELPHASAGGGSDGNFTGAAGIATLDGLGVRGAGYHTLEEHIEVASLVDRGRLLAGLIAALA